MTAAARGEGPGAAPEALTALVADDEALARRRILALLDGREDVRAVGESATGRATVDAVRRHRPDILFLDVQMPGLDGFEALERLDADERPVIIFSTAYDEYALAAFEVNAVDYLLKPFSDERFNAALDRAGRALRNQRAGDLHARIRSLLEDVDGPGDRADADGYRRRFAARTGDRVTVVPTDEIDWIEAAGDYARLHARGESHLVRTTMAALEDELDPARFIRVHRSAIARIDRVRLLEPDDHGDYDIVLDGGARIRVGRSYRENVLERLGR